MFDAVNLKEKRQVHEASGIQVGLGEGVYPEGGDVGSLPQGKHQ